MIDEAIVERVRREVPILDLMVDIPLQRTGSIWKGLCPIHAEKTPSFTVDPGKNTWKCWGCGRGGSTIDWLKESTGASFTDAVAVLAARIGVIITDQMPSLRKEEPRRKKLPAPRALPDRLADFHRGTNDQHVALATLRGFDPATVEEAVRRKFVGFTATQWCVRDNTGVNGERRLLSGEKYPGGIKTKNFTGSWGAWPLGCTEFRPGYSVLLCEGSPDFIAGLEVCLRGLKADPCGVLGASNTIHPAAVPFFKRKRVIIAKHKDTAGDAAVGRWAAALPQSLIVVLELPSYVSSDLNDWIIDTPTAEVVEEIQNQIQSK